MERWVGKVAVVTGASSGIGLAIAKAFVRKGMVVVGLARRKGKMEESMKGIKGKFYGCECDVTNEQNVTEVFQWIKKNVGVIQVLVNNAGIALPGTLTETSRKDWENVFNINVLGLLTCTKLAVNMMKEADVEGHIININSTVGHRVYAFKHVEFNVYPASKHAVTAITETLQNELLKNLKIKVTSISPGFVKTEILGTETTGEIPFKCALEAEDIAEAAVYVIGTPRRVQITELTIRPLGEDYYA